ncbi:type I DNA topoisomerase [Patescibacteria group bacterium]|nr:type I DNA topoisomerase [Patescibacteria group bacterium]MBU1519474.1 type I DNA topoisomerase [Patescibacteria group bacterium]MBU2010476.1 type I DNA topoisomerase [Patescibacteria group bacterium]MBU2416574.1 type I DNA topoisomerase [Patescibacteria group bacterium]MBU2461133.1 type I DNA topoisomerase [Patescibacteria group bacterium]
MKLLIVESPTKIKTLTKYISDSSYTVKASVGHIRDLPKNNKKAIDIEGGFIPHYEIIAGKERIVADLKKSAKKADEILLAMDPDREGEAIAWHIVEALNLDKNANVKRIVFNEITKSAIEEALGHPRAIDQDLRQAQEARRVLDRLVGYDLSGLIWKKVRYGLSAGRVQSPALRIIMEKEREIRAFNTETFWTITARNKTKNGVVFETVCEEEPRDKKLVDDILEKARAGSWFISDIKETETRRAPYAPFTTSTLQQTASSRLGLSPSRAMQIAQKLYEAGHITYMRTDSTTLSKDAQGQIARIIEEDFGKNLYMSRVYKTRSKNAQEAHEAIRPSHVKVKTINNSVDQNKLYQLIRARTIASQMSDAKILRTKVITNIHEHKIPNFSIMGARVLFPGWFLADPAAKSEDVELPKLSKNETLELVSIDSEEKQTQPPNRYTEAGLIKELEKRGIGRPSTYASIMKTLDNRGYVEKQGRTLFPTDTGEVVNDFLEKYFMKYISDDFTAKMEEELDDIAEGKRGYRVTLEEFYGPFSKDVLSKENIEKVNTLGNADEQYKCPKCGDKMIIKLGKNGKFMSCSKFPKCSGARTIEGKELAGPKETGKMCPKCKDGKLVEREGRFGKFISCSNYPKCKYIEESEEETKRKATGVICPECKKGEMVERKGRFGIFYSCSNYPKCKYAIKAKPTGNICSYVRKDKDGEKCGALMMTGTKTIPERCSNKTCPNHNPHKLDAK